MEPIHDRVNLLINRLKTSQTQFAILTQNSNQNIYNICKGKYLPSFTILYNILINIQNLSAEWLLLGRGEIFTTDQIQEKAEPPKVSSLSGSDLSELIQAKNEVIKEKEKRIEDLQGFIKILLAEREKLDRNNEAKTA